MMGCKSSTHGTTQIYEEVFHSHYRLLVLDIDGTLTGPDGRVSEKNASAVRRLQYRGTPVTLATGRSERSTMPLARALGIRTPIITYNGGKIIAPQSGARLLKRRISWKDALRLCRTFKASESDAALFIYTDDAILGLTGATESDGHLLTQDNGILLKMRTVRDVENYAATHPNGAPLKMMVGGHPSELQELATPWREAFEPHLGFVQSEPDYLDVLPAGTNKGSALEWLAGHIHVPIEQIATMGNAHNDIEMLRLAGLGIAVSDAHPDVIRAADRLAPASGEDAVAAAIDRLFPTQSRPFSSRHVPAGGSEGPHGPGGVEGPRQTARFG